MVVKVEVVVVVWELEVVESPEVVAVEVVVSSHSNHSRRTPPGFSSTVPEVGLANPRSSQLSTLSCSDAA